MAGHRRPKSVRKARAAAIAREERTYSKDPHSFIFTRPGVGNLVKQLSLDLREIFEPYTASRLKTHKRNVLKDFIAIAGPLHVTHLLYLTHPHADKREKKRQRQLVKKSERKESKTDPEGDRGSGKCVQTFLVGGVLEIIRKLGTKGNPFGLSPFTIIIDCLDPLLILTELTKRLSVVLVPLAVIVLFVRFKLIVMPRIPQLLFIAKAP